VSTGENGLASQPGASADGRVTHLGTLSFVSQPDHTAARWGREVGSVGEELGYGRSELLVELEDPTVAGVGVDGQLTVLDSAMQVLGEG